MATALISGLSKSAKSDLKIRVSDPSEDARQRLQSNFGVTVFSDAVPAITDADVVVLAVKPQVMPAVLQSLAVSLKPHQLVLSIAAGVSMATIGGPLQPGQAIIRSMPNTPALIGAGISGVCAGEHCKPHHRAQAEKILQAAGDVVWIEDESMMDAVTAISGSGPAYFFALAEALAKAGHELGLPADVSRRLAEHTCAGAGAMLNTSADSAAELRRRVTSPGGTTQAALEAFQQGGLDQLVLDAATAARDRGVALSGEAAAGCGNTDTSASGETAS